MIPEVVSQRSLREKTRGRTLTLKIFLHTLEPNITGSPNDQNAQESLYMERQERRLSESQQYWFDESPQNRNRNEQDPQEQHTSLKMNPQISLATAASESLRSKGIERGGTSKRNTPSYKDGRGIILMKEAILDSPVTKASIKENAATDNSFGPRRPAMTIDAVWIEFWRIYDNITVQNLYSVVNTLDTSMNPSTHLESSRIAET
jgi:hypothetical protein